MKKSTLPGRLGDADMTVLTDPRADHRLVAAIELAAEAQSSVEIPSGAATPEIHSDLMASITNFARSL